MKLDGQPLPEAAIVFEPVGKGRPSIGVTDVEGRYTLEFAPGKPGAVLGKHRVRISTWQPGYDNGTVHPPTPERVPALYNHDAEKTPEMTRDVSGSETTIDFDLTSKAGTIVQPEAATSKTRRPD